MLPLRSVAWGLALGVAAACGQKDAFICGTDGDCGTDQRCEITGYCSVPDGSCGSGRRYTESAREEFAAECVPTTGGTETSTSTTTTAATTTTTTSASSDSGGTTIGVGTLGSSGSSSGEGSSTGGPACHPIMVQVLGRTPTGDQGREWAQLLNICPDPIDLGGYSLGWGLAAYTEGVMDLAGMLAPGACHLVGGPISDLSNYSPVYDQVSEFIPQLAGTEDAGIGLFTGPSAAIDGLSIPVDALIWGDVNIDLVDPMGQISPPLVPAPPSDQGFRRTAIAPTWMIEPAPEPNVCPVL